MLHVFQVCDVDTAAVSQGEGLSVFLLQVGQSQTEIRGFGGSVTLTALKLRDHNQT